MYVITSLLPFYSPGHIYPIKARLGLTNGPSPNFDNCYHLIESVIPRPPLTFYYLCLFFITA